jgi:hypothetical protein
MGEVVGYVTLEEANAYVTGHFMSSNMTRVAWESLSDADKLVLLRNSYRAIEMLTFRGRKTSMAQPSAFPRWPSNVVPGQIKEAQIANAIVLADESSREDVAYYDKLRTFGVKSYHIGNLSETLNTSAEGSAASSYSGIYSQEALRLLSPWLGGGFKIV